MVLLRMAVPAPFHAEVKTFSLLNAIVVLHPALMWIPSYRIGLLLLIIVQLQHSSVQCSWSIYVLKRCVRQQCWTKWPDLRSLWECRDAQCWFEFFQAYVSMCHITKFFFQNLLSFSFLQEWSAWSWGLSRERTFPPIFNACHVYHGTSRSLKSQQPLCCLCIFFFYCQELNWEAMKHSCTCEMVQKAWRIKENKDRLWAGESEYQSFKLAKPGHFLLGSSC